VTLCVTLGPLVDWTSLVNCRARGTEIGEPSQGC